MNVSPWFQTSAVHSRDAVPRFRQMKGVCLAFLPSAKGKKMQTGESLMDHEVFVPGTFVPRRPSLAQVL